MRRGEGCPVVQLHALLKVCLILFQEIAGLGTTRTTKDGRDHEGTLSHYIGSPLECGYVTNHILEFLLLKRAAFLSEP